MNPFYKALENLRNEEELVLLKQPQPSESSLYLPTVESTGQDDDGDPAVFVKARYLPTDDEPENNAETFIKESLTGESQYSSTSIPPAVDHTIMEKEILGTGSLNIRLMDQYPCYGVSDKGELTLLGDTIRVSNRNSSHAGAEVRSGSFLEEGDFSLVTEENTQEHAKDSGSLSTLCITRSDNNVDGFVQDGDTNGVIPPKQALEKDVQTAESTMHSLQQPCASPEVELPQIAVIPDQKECIKPRVPLLPAGIELQPRQTPQDDPLFSELFSEPVKPPQMATQSQLFPQKVVASTPSVRLELTPKVKSGKRCPRTPPTAASSRSVRFLKLSGPSQNPAVCAPIQFPQIFQGMFSDDISMQKGGPSEKSMLVRNVRNLPVAPSKLHPSSNSDETGRPNVTPTSMLDAQVPFQFEDPNVNTENRGNTAIPETLHGMTLDPSQVLENERLIRHARNMVGKRQISTPDHSFVTPVKRIRPECVGSEVTGVQPATQDVNKMFTDIQMSPVTAPTQEMLLKGHLAESLGLPLTGRTMVQNFQEQPSFSPFMIPNNASNALNVGPAYSMNHNDTNVRSEDVDLPKRHHCKACLAVFAFKENCDRHYKVVHLKRQVFRCPHCTSSYLQPKTMRGHIDKKHCVKTGEVSILPCYWCPATFGNHQEWEFHAAQAHPEQRSKFRGMSP